MNRFKFTSKIIVYSPVIFILIAMTCMTSFIYKTKTDKCEEDIQNASLNIQRNFEKMISNRVNTLLIISAENPLLAKKNIQKLHFDDNMKLFLITTAKSNPRTLVSNQKKIELDYASLGSDFFQNLRQKQKKFLIKKETISYFAIDRKTGIAICGVLDRSFIDEKIAKMSEVIIKKSHEDIRDKLITIFLFGAILLFIVYMVARKISFNIKEYKEKIEQDAIHLKQKNEELTKMLYTDILTKLPNKKALQKDILNMKAPKLIICDLDSFRNINEYYGTEVGDFLLLYFSEYLQKFVHDTNMQVYRIGADEFALLEDEVLDIEKYEELISELTKDIKTKEIAVDGVEKPIEIHTTIGFSLESEDIIAKAIMALNYAKVKQKDYACYMRNIDTKDLYAQQVKYSNIIKEAIANDKLLPYFQPIFNRKKEVTKYECLARIVNDKEEIISPGLFLETSKNIRQYPKMTKVLVDKAFKMISKSDKMVSINMLARDMSDSDVSNYILDKIAEYDIAKQVVLEILEDENIENIDRIGSYLQRVRRMGVKIAIDDFGTGYSNFSYLLKLKPDYIKIDGSLIKNIDNDANSIAIVSAILTFAKTLGIKTVAEFIHSKEVYDKCLELGIDEFQGFYLAEPSSSLLEKDKN